MERREPRVAGELVQFKIVEKEIEVEVPKYVERIVEVPVYKEVEYEKPVCREVEYEKPVLVPKDLTGGLRELIKTEIERCLAEVIQSLKISMEIPMARVLQVRPGGKKEEI
ncbi:MAG: hypothetical protein K6T27_09395 [Thermoleophilum sp.]|nr:hypothetical protein [Thermoleophilum sp.]